MYKLLRLEKVNSGKVVSNSYYHMIGDSPTFSNSFSVAKSPFLVSKVYLICNLDFKKFQHYIHISECAGENLQAI